jgi:hypothetical protein
MHICQIGSIRPFIFEGACKLQVNSLVTARIDYWKCLTGVNRHVLHGQTSTCTKHLCQISRTDQKKKHEQVTPKLHRLPVKYHIQYQILMFVFKCLNNLAPAYLSELIVPYKPARSLGSESTHLINMPVTKAKTYIERSFDNTVATLEQLVFLLKSETFRSLTTLKKI